jgi:hypothetical protein
VFEPYVNKAITSNRPRLCPPGSSQMNNCLGDGLSYSIQREVLMDVVLLTLLSVVPGENLVEAEGAQTCRFNVVPMISVGFRQ